MKNFSEIMVNASGYVLTATMTKEVLQIVALICSILGTVIIAITRIIDWYIRAKQDGKIDSNEIKELGQIVEEEKDKIEKETKE